ncbi:MAG TPA: glycoside hydrolase family 15 protein [Gemmataceae bacterium]|nr:glycoside hydrolase family 15 protein [Gemmataceae bacterium]
MPSRIEDYALIGDLHTAALVGRDGSIDWLCLPRFDSGACFAALLGTADNGRWLIRPSGEVRAVRRRYREGTLVLETEFDTAEGTAVVIDCMPVRETTPHLLRIVEGRRGHTAMHVELVIRFDYGSIVPWVQRRNGGLSAVAGPDRLVFCSPVPLVNKNFKTTADFTVAAGQRQAFTLSWGLSHHPPPEPVHCEKSVEETDRWWRKWSGRCQYQGPWREAVSRSLITLKALTYHPTGGITAAATTSLPEKIGGVRNWDYRICWLRDATFTLLALLSAGYVEEARAWRGWLHRAVAGDPAATNIMYGLAGERRLPELELDWLLGYEKSSPVRIGNAASKQFQLDVYGEVLDAMFQARRHGLEPEKSGWAVGSALTNFVARAWKEPDEGIWEVRGGRKHFTHSKVMAWVALDRAIKAVETFGLAGPVDRWRKTRDEIHQTVCEKGFNRDLGSFVQTFGAKELDASLLMIPLVGFLPPSDPRVRGTVEAIEKGLMRDGFVQRYDTRTETDGLPPGEGAFLACTFWLADNYHLLGRQDDARRTFERLLSLCNDVGLLSEQYDPAAKRLVGNFPQAFSHTALVNTAMSLSGDNGSAGRQRES